MIIVQEEYFLNEEGQHNFPMWMGRLGVVLSRFDGFMSIRQITDLSEPEACCLLMEFENVEQHTKWSGSKEHNDLLAQLNPYRARRKKTLVYEVGPRVARRGTRADIPGVLSE